MTGVGRPPGASADFPPSRPLPIPFSRSLRSLRADRVRGRVALLLAAGAVLALWTTWW